MAARPSHRPHRDRGPYITLKWQQVEPVRFPSQWEKRGPVGGTETGLTCPNVALVSLQQHVRSEKRAAVVGADTIICCAELNFSE